ncbi:MAG: STAS domain-containing protein [Pirellulaceae bacterium]|nr:STAS domain-containing protein [Pirellulaceae bacterium]
MNMSIQVDRRANRVVLHCKGNLDADGSREVKRAVQSLDEDGAVPLVLDLSAVSSITNPGPSLAVIPEQCGP